MEHGIAGGLYDNLGRQLYGRQVCVLECLCGAGFNGRDWQEAGEGLDTHLKEIVDEINTRGATQ